MSIKRIPRQVTTEGKDGAVLDGRIHIIRGPVEGVAADDPAGRCGVNHSIAKLNRLAPGLAVIVGRGDLESLPFDA